MPRVTLPGFDYGKRSTERFEVPIGERIAAIRARKAADRMAPVAAHLGLTDAVRGSASRSYQVTVTGNLTVNPATLPVATVGTLYAQTLTATGATGTRNGEQET